MGNLLEAEPPNPDEFNFLGMTYECDVDHFRTTIKEEMEVIFVIPYFINWAIIVGLGTLGIIFT